MNKERGIICLYKGVKKDDPTSVILIEQGKEGKSIAMFKEMGVKTFYIGKSLEDPKRATVMFQGPVNTCYDIFVNPETKPIVEASGHIYEGTIINRWISE